MYSYPIPAKYRADEDDAGVIHTYLESKGHVVTGVTINARENRIEIETDRDPLADLQAFDPPLSPRQKAIAAVQELNSIDIDTADLATLRRALKLERALINYALRTP